MIHDLLLTGILVLSVFLPFWLFIYLSILIHELGHLLGAVLVGWDPYFLAIGVINRRLSFRLGDVRVKVGWNPFGGLTRSVPRNLDSFKSKYIAIILSGLVASALYAVSLYLAYRFFQTTKWSALSSPVIKILLFWEAVLLFCNLFPHKMISSGERLLSDGLNLWTVVRSAPLAIRMTYNASLLRYARVLIEEKDGTKARHIVERINPSPRSEPLAQSTWITALLLLGCKTEAQNETETLLNDNERTNQTQAAILDAVACIPLFGDHPSFLPLAARCLEEAMKRTPEAITLKGTKGALLVENGDLETGIAMLEEVRSQSEAENDQGICAYYLAYAAFKKGDNAVAIERLREAKEKYPQCVVAARIERKIVT